MNFINKALFAAFVVTSGSAFGMAFYRPANRVAMPVAARVILQRQVMRPIYQVRPVRVVRPVVRPVYAIQPVRAVGRVVRPVYAVRPVRPVPVRAARPVARVVRPVVVARRAVIAPRPVMVRSIYQPLMAQPAFNPYILGAARGRNISFGFGFQI